MKFFIILDYYKNYFRKINLYEKSLVYKTDE